MDQSDEFRHESRITPLGWLGVVAGIAALAALVALAVVKWPANAPRTDPGAVNPPVAATTTHQTRDCSMLVVKFEVPDGGRASVTTPKGVSTFVRSGESYIDETCKGFQSQPVSVMVFGPLLDSTAQLNCSIRAGTEVLTSQTGQGGGPVICNALY